MIECELKIHSFLEIKTGVSDSELWLLGDGTKPQAHRGCLGWQWAVTVDTCSEGHAHELIIYILLNKDEILGIHGICLSLLS